jgi:hypothetical protein
MGALVTLVTRAQATKNPEVADDRQSHIGKLDKAWDEATAEGWTVVSMKGDWKTIFPFVSPVIVFI